MDTVQPPKEVGGEIVDARLVHRWERGDLWFSMGLAELPYLQRPVGLCCEWGIA